MPTLVLEKNRKLLKRRKFRKTKALMKFQSEKNEFEFKKIDGEVGLNILYRKHDLTLSKK
jgi:hypothetical protein